jgi:hypothetical protein
MPESLQKAGYILAWVSMPRTKHHFGVFMVFSVKSERVRAH